MKSSLTILLLIIMAIPACCQDTFDPSKVRSSILQRLQTFPPDNDTNDTKEFDLKTRKIITNDELLELTNYPKVMVRQAALSLLIDRHYKNIFDLFSKNKADTSQWTRIRVECGKLSMTFIDRLVFYLSPPSGWRRYFTISSEQDAMLLLLTEERRNRLLRYYAAGWDG